MRKATFRAHYHAAGWLVGFGFALAFVAPGDFVWDGGSHLAATLAIAPAMAVLAALVLTRCGSCSRSLGWISAHRNFDDQPDPRTLDTCPNCGQPFFRPPAQSAGPEE